MKKAQTKERLETRLLAIPFEQMLRAMEAIDDFDMLLLSLIESEGSREELQQFQSKLVDRRERRRRFIEFRFQLETAAGEPPIVTMDLNLDIH